MSGQRYRPERHDKWTHGTHVTYSHGCRCEACREGHRAYERNRRERAIDLTRYTHGTLGTYDLGCRCAECAATKKASRKRAAS